MENTVTRILLPVCLLLASVSAHGEYPKKESDFAALPPYCKAKLFYGNKNSQYNTWQQRMGKETFVHVHHYCAALFSIDLALRDQARRDFLLKTALSEIAYMEKQAPISSPLMPEILAKKGRVLQMQGRGPEAVLTFHQSIGLKKNYTPAYMAIADYYISIGQYDEAMAITEKGLKIKPKSRGLQRRKDKISGKLSAVDKADNSAVTDQTQKPD